METMRLQNKRTCALTLILLVLFQMSLICAKAMNDVHIIPAEANLGYVVASLEKSAINSFSNIVNDHASKLFTVSGGLLKTKAQLSRYAGQRFKLKIKRSSEQESVEDNVSIHIDAGVSLNQFYQQPYSGEVAENSPIGTKITGLDDLVADMKRFSFVCQFSLSGPDSVFVSLEDRSLLTRVSVDYEQRSFWVLVIKATCPSKVIQAEVTVDVINVNDNAPQFDSPDYLGIWDFINVIQVTATDIDQDHLGYSLNDSSLFQINPDSGVITLQPDAQFLAPNNRYDLEVRADDGVHVAKASVRIVIFSLSSDSYQRQTIRCTRLVIRRSDTGSLFSVASMPPIPEERFQFRHPSPEGLTINEVTGMISLIDRYVWNTTLNDLYFGVNIMRSNNLTFFDPKCVRVRLVDRRWDEAIFTNQPTQMRTTIPEWIRPDTQIFRVTSIYAPRYTIIYLLESDSSGGCFRVDPQTGDVFINCRRQFELGSVYTLAISAQSPYAARRMRTPTQGLQVYVGSQSPQFFLHPYVVNMSESLAPGSIAANIQAVSFQKVRLTYSVVTMDTKSVGVFELQPDGGLRLLKKLKHVSDPHQYRMFIKVKEESTDFESSTELIVNLIGENLNTPIFPARVYVVRNIREDHPIGSEVTRVRAIDIDQGKNGNLIFATDSEFFSAETFDGKTAIIKVVKRLDYDWTVKHRYIFALTATDGGTPIRSWSTSVRVWVDNVNDEAPVMEPPNQVVRVNEDAGDGLRIHTVQAYDPDGHLLDFSFQSGSAQDFNIDRRTGDITLRAGFKPGTGDMVLPIVISDGTNTTRGEVNVKFIGVNHPPRFPDCDSYFSSTNIMEQTADQTRVLRMRAIDDDFGDNGELNFKVVVTAAQEKPLFAVGNITRSNDEYLVDLVSIVVFDREKPSRDALFINGKLSYKVTVRAEDNGTPKLASNCFFFVEVKDKNDKIPRFDLIDYKTIIMRNIQANQRVIRVFAVDADSGINGEVSYELVKNDSRCLNCFQINAQTGWITRAAVGSLSMVTQIKLEVQAKDGQQSLSSVHNVTIDITDNQADLAPVFLPLNGLSLDDIVIFVNENITEASDFLQVSTNKEAILSVQYGRTAMENQAKNFNRKSGYNSTSMVIMADKLNYEQVTQYSVKLRAAFRTTEGSHFTDTRVTIKVKDLNNRAPVFEGLDASFVYPAAVTEKTKIGDRVVKVTAIDVDGTDPFNKVVYSFPPSCPDCSAFNINRNTGDITAAQTFDPGQVRSYILKVIAEDSAPASGGSTAPNKNEIDVTVRVTGPSLNPPYFPQQSYVITLDEGVNINTTVTTVVATDPLPGENVLQYTIVGGNTDRRFAVNSETARIYTLREISLKDKTKYDLLLGVFDGIQLNTTTVTINIRKKNIYPPQFTLFDVNVTDVKENDLTISAMRPKLLATVVAVDPEDPNQAIRYRLEGDYYSNDRFEIVSNGSIFLKQPLDRDYPMGTDDWLINIVAQEQGADPLDGYGMLHLRLQDENDNGPVFDVCCTVGRIMENSIPGSLVADIIALDYDSGRNSQIVFEKGSLWPKTLTGTDLFQLSTAGKLTTTASAILDRESKDTYSAIVIARDGGTPQRTSEQLIEIVILDDNDNKPIFKASRYTIEMPEELPIGASVGSVFATDADIGENARLTFSITSQPASQYFYMDSLDNVQSGVIRMLQRIDYENQMDKNMTFNIQVRDINPLNSDTTTVTIVITDVNDNAPSFINPKRQVNITEESDAAWSMSFTANDIDSGLNARFEYAIDYESSKDLDRRFQINSKTGDVSLRKTLDRETMASYNLYILAIDKGEPALTGTATLVVTVLDKNDNAPMIGSMSSQHPTVGVNTQIGSEVLRFGVKDPDAGNSQVTVTYACNKPECRDFETSTIGVAGQQEVLVRAKKNGYTASSLSSDRIDLPFELTDGNGLKRTVTIPVYVSGNPAATFQADTGYITVYNYKARLNDTNIGTVYCKSSDGVWTPEGKSFSPVGGVYAYFNILNNGSIIMRRGAPRGNHTLDVNVMNAATKNTAVCKMQVDIFYLYEDAVNSSASIRITGKNAADFVRIGDGRHSDYTTLQSNLAKLLNTQVEYVQIFAVKDVTGSDSPAVDVYYAAHGSPYYRPARLNGLVWSNRANLVPGLTVLQAPVSECLKEPCYNGGCSERMYTTGKPDLIVNQQTSFVGLEIETKQTCTCASGNEHETSGMTCQVNSCLNNGTCYEENYGYKCACLPEFEGPRCEQTKLSFKGNGWAWFSSLPSCNRLKLSFEFMSLQASSLLMYNGPMSDTSGTNYPDFISVELVAGYPKVRINTGNPADVVLSVNGKNSKNEKKLAELNDGKWHTIEIYKEGENFQEYRLVVDHCRTAEITENIGMSESDRRSCESTSSASSADRFLTLNTPLQLGGRFNTVNYPQGLAGNAFTGCIKNLWANDKLYDLHIGEVGESMNTEDGCTSEGCSSCPGNSTCVGTMSGNPVCSCLPGYMGNGCQQRTPVKDFLQNGSYIEWRLSPDFNRSLSASENTLQLMFRTRQDSGILFFADSFSTLERLIIEVSSSKLQVRFDLGAGDNILSLPHVTVSDGQWHTVHLSRYGNQVSLRLDNGMGDYYAEMWPVSAHRLLALRGTTLFGAAHVTYNPWNGQPTVTGAMKQSCVMDVRYNNRWFPMERNYPEPTSATVERIVNADDNCESNACSGISCPYGFCVDLWRSHTCMCDYGRMLSGSACVPVMDCSIPRCVHGDCVLIDGANGGDDWRCNCYGGYSGVYCNGTIIAPFATTRAVSDGGIAAIVICLLALLLAIILIIIFVRRRKPQYLLDDPEDDIRETVRNYDEEGAGEEDTHGYDLTRLPKPVDPNRNYQLDDADRPYARVDEPPRVPDPEEMPHVRSRPSFPNPAEYPNVGDFIGDRLDDADKDPNAPPYDSVREYEFEGGGSTAGSLSSLQSSSSGDLDFDYLRDLGPQFRKLADMYGGDE